MTADAAQSIRELLFSQHTGSCCQTVNAKYAIYNQITLSTVSIPDKESEKINCQAT